MTENGAFKKKRVCFAQVSNDALRDPNLSLKAKGLYALIQSYITLENFTLYKNKLKKECKEGDKAFESTWKELKDCGYLMQYKYKKDDGTFYYEYDLLDTSNHTPKKYPMDNDNVEKDNVEKGGTRKRGQYNNTNLKNTNLKNTNNNTDKKVVAGNFNNFEQRDYDFEDLEKKLLGWE